MNLLEYGKLEEERKRWNRTIAQFDDDVEKCEHCGGPMEQGMVSHEAIGVEYFMTCKNPNCVTNNL